MAVVKFNDNSPDLDRETFEGLRAILGSEFDTILRSFFHHARLYIDQIQKGIHDKNSQIIVSVAHRLAASAAQMGFVKMAHIAKTLEMESSHKPFCELSELVLLLQTTYDNARLKSENR
jgi:HPt (histidine-containing phosphotransfer) domain-containing protein